MANHATLEGTLEYMEQAVKRGIRPEHFRQFQGLFFSSLGIGTYLGEPDDHTDVLVKEAIKKSILSGAVNVVDTAINYRFQKAERAVGKALKQLTDQGLIKRESVFISSKNGYLTHDADTDVSFQGYVSKNFLETQVLDSSDIVGGVHCMKVSYLRDQLERSLRNLGLDCIDLLYIHNSAESQIPYVGLKEYLSRLRLVFEYYEQERRLGRIRYYGLATWSCFRVLPGDKEYLSLEKASLLAEEVGGREHGFKFIQLPFNLAMPEAYTLENQKVGDELYSTFEAANRLGIGVFNSAPLLEGQLLHHVKKPFVEGTTTGAQSCLQFVRSAPNVAALAGHKQPEHVEENLELAFTQPLAREAFEKLVGNLF